MIPCLLPQIGPHVRVFVTESGLGNFVMHFPVIFWVDSLEIPVVFFEAL